jgi:hypothetical protein
MRALKTGRLRFLLCSAGPLACAFALTPGCGVPDVKYDGPAGAPGAQLEVTGGTSGAADLSTGGVNGSATGGSATGGSEPTSGAAGAGGAPSGCQTNADCDSASDRPICNQETGLCVQCLPDQDQCAEGQYCAADNTCQTGCADDSECPDELSCNLSTHLCVGCVGDDDCPAGSVCSAAESTCVPGCTADHPCPAGERCCAGACANVQQSAEHCGACLQACSANHGTPSCTGGQCQIDCDDHWADCDENARTNGCESDLSTRENCGECERLCENVNVSQNRCVLNEEQNEYECVPECAAGFADDDDIPANGCETNVDDCASNACENGGVCIDGVDSYSCDCTGTGFSGTRCQNDVNECALGTDNCDPLVSCTNTPGSFTCGACPSDYADTNGDGTLCTRIDDCAPNPCQHGGSCTDGDDSYSCDCTGTGYTGAACETDIDECALGTHQCDSLVACTNTPGSYSCGACPAGYEGDGQTCTDIDGCATDPCVNGTCQDVPAPGTGATCTCTAGWEGALCDQDIDGCADSPCAGGVPCTDVPAPGTGYLCGSCPQGYDDVNGDGTECVEIDACRSHACINGTCVDLPPPSTTYTCACSPGWTGTYCDQDADGCANHQCQNGSICTDNIAPATGYTCNCLSGWEGALCQIDIDGCAGNSCVNGTCQDVAAPGTGYTCTCDPGWAGTYCSQDANGCVPNPCFAGVTCTDVPAPGTGFTCGACPTGYTGDGISCTDLDGCQTHACVNGTCQDVAAPGTGYTCACQAGWGGTYCDQDVDGCASSPCFPGVTCTDVAAPGTGFTCGACPTGYEGDGVSCTNLDACSGHACVNGTCQDQPPPSTGYSCTCDTGWTGTYCDQDIDGCASGPCFPGVSCTDVPAPGTGFTCGACPTGYEGDGATCTNLDACQSNPCVNGTCVDQPPPGTGYSCTCSSGWEGALCDQDIDGCAGDPCSGGVECVDVPAPGTGYTCGGCPPGYTGDGEDCIEVDGCLSHACVNGTCLDDAPPSDGYTCSCDPGWEGTYCSQDTDGCASHQCQNGSICTDNPAPATGYTCSCLTGWQGALCQIDIDGCAGHACINGACQDVPAPGTGYTCNCDTGWTGTYCSQDINGCAGNPCFPGVTCTDVPAPGTGYTCGACPPGYTGDGQTCSNIDGCQGHACANGSTCVDDAPPSTGYTCTCTSGWEGTLCDQDIDGCAGEPCSGGVTCTDVPAPGTGYTCGACPPGYDDINGDGTECVEIDGCVNHECANGSTCQDEPPPSSGYTCVCTSGWEGTLCDQDINGCATTPCFPGVTCTDVPAPGTGFTCGACPAGYAGDGETCTDLDACQTHACVNGTCLDDDPPSTGYSCECSTGWEGTYCDQDTDGCIGNQCQNGSSCTDNPAPATGYTCNCTPGWEGALCQTDIDGCQGNACVNGTCQDVPAPGTGYTCSCETGWTGTYCSQDINGCATDPCFPGVTCTDVPAPGTGFTCGACPAGYEGDGISCTDINGCLAHACVNGTCVDLAPPASGYSCSCDTGWEGTYCDQDIDGCATGPCFPGVACTDVAAPGTGFTCGACPTGYEGDGISCTDINGCLSHACVNGTCQDVPAPGTGYNCSCTSGWEGVLCDQDIDGCASGPCFPTVTCTDVAAPGTGFTCGPCPTGYTGDGITCTNYDACSPNPCANGTCTDHAPPSTGFTCNCPSGWEGTLCDQDVDGCAGDPCFPGVTCTDVAAPGTGFTCGSCPAGYAGDGITCTDYDACQSNSCVHGDCVDDAPPSTSYTCSCDTGWTGTYCNQDINGCIGNQCQHGSTCVDVAAPGEGYTCTCLSGWEGALCQNDINGCIGNECVVGQGSCVDVAAPGTGYTCSCSSGWQGTYCETDINGCIGNSCNTHATCHDVPAPGTGYTCTCNSGYTGNGFVCTDINECQQGTDNCHTHATCTNTPGSFYCTCNSGYTGNGVTCTDINECQQGTDDCDPVATCTNTPGSFTCTCPAGYTDVYGDGTLCLGYCERAGSGNYTRSCTDYNCGFGSVSYNYTQVNSSTENPSRMVMVGVHCAGQNSSNLPYISGVTYAGTSMHQIAQATGGAERAALYALNESGLPTTDGSKAVVVTLGDNQAYRVCTLSVLELKNAKQGDLSTTAGKNAVFETIAQQSPTQDCNNDQSEPPEIYSVSASTHSFGYILIGGSGWEGGTFVKKWSSLTTLFENQGVAYGKASAGYVQNLSGTSINFGYTTNVCNHKSWVAVVVDPT